jgi:inner membrane protein
MASAFSHIAIPIVLYIACKDKPVNFRLFLLAALVCILPDADVLAFKLGIAYESEWGHRGFTHSLFFAILIAAWLTTFSTRIGVSKAALFWVCSVSCASHALLDALTNGGLGVALFWPVSDVRFFFPYRPIEVSPIGIANFFSERGLQVLASELRWIILPATVISLIALALRRR